MIRKVLLTLTPHPVSADVLAYANANGVGEIVHPIDGAFRGEFAGLAPGLHEIAMPDASDPVPDEVSAAQALCVLEDDGLLVAVEALVAQQPASVQRFWSRQHVFRRDDPTLNALASALGFADQLDDMFRRAKMKTAAG